MTQREVVNGVDVEDKAGEALVATTEVAVATSVEARPDLLKTPGNPMDFIEKAMQARAQGAQGATQPQAAAPRPTQSPAQASAGDVERLTRRASEAAERAAAEVRSAAAEVKAKAEQVLLAQDPETWPRTVAFFDFKRLKRDADRQILTCRFRTRVLVDRISMHSLPAKLLFIEDIMVNGMSILAHEGKGLGTAEILAHDSGGLVLDGIVGGPDAPLQVVFINRAAVEPVPICQAHVRIIPEKYPIETLLLK